MRIIFRFECLHIGGFSYFCNFWVFFCICLLQHNLRFSSELYACFRVFLLCLLRASIRRISFRLCACVCELAQWKYFISPFLFFFSSCYGSLLSLLLLSIYFPLFLFFSFLHSLASRRHCSRLIRWLEIEFDRVGDSLILGLCMVTYRFGAEFYYWN